jgi:hypothetical protein
LEVIDNLPQFLDENCVCDHIILVDIFFLVAVG